MIKINKEIVKEMVGYTNYGKGLTIQKNKKVKLMNVDIEKNEAFTMIEINAEVGDLNSKNNEYPIIRIIEDYGLGKITIEGGCNCSYAERSDNICMHQTATLIEFVKNKAKYVKNLKNKEELRVEKLIENIKKISSQENIDTELKKPLKSEYTLIIEANRYNKDMFLEMKLGENQLYIVRNMREFAENILENKTIYFGKKFTYDPRIHKFNEIDKKILKFICSVYEQDLMIKELNSYLMIRAGFFKGKSVRLTENNLKKILGIFNGGNINLKINNTDFPNVFVTEEKVPLEFKLINKGDKIVLKQKSELPVPITNDGDVIFYERTKTIYKISDKQVKIYGEIFNHFVAVGKKEIGFKKQNIEDVASYVLPKLKEVSKNIEIDKKLKNKFVEEPLKSKIYLDKEGKSAKANIVFQYGNEEINPLAKNDKNKKNKSDKILIRDTKSENDIINMLKMFGFEDIDGNYKVKNQDEIFEFIVKGIDKLKDSSEIYYSDSFKNMKIYKPSNYNSSVRLNKEDLLEFDFSIDGVDKKELEDIFESLEQKKKYHRLKDGAFIDLANDEIREAKNLMDNLNINIKDLKKDKVVIPKSNAIYIDSLINENKMNFVQRNENFKELIANISTIDEKEWKLEKNLDKIMRKYQKFGFKWFKTLSSLGFGGILADEMGLGKTLQTIAFIKSEVNKKEKMPCIVICPTSLVYNWEDEINKFQKDLKSVVVSGTKKERKEAIEKIKDADVVITSYALIRRDIEEYKEMKFKYCFIDEAQNIKNASSLNAKSVKSIRAKGYFALTGTPIENSLGELWSIFDFIMPGYLFSRGEFSKRYEIPIVKSKDKKVLKELNRRIKPFILRRLKKDVIKELPSKIEHNIVVDMTDKQKKVYAAFSKKAKSEMMEKIKNKEFNKSKIQILSMITRLRQICCDPTTCIEDYTGGSGKMDALLDIVSNNIEEKHKMLIFSQFTSVLKNISGKLKEKGIEHLYLDGSVKSSLRGDIVRKFNEGDSNVFLISLKAGGTGLNLTSADIVIHYDPWWNPSVEEQATDRAHRIGQKNTVEVIRLIAKGSIEEKINKIQKQKKEIIKNVMDENVGNDISLLNMSEEEIKNLFS